MRDHQRITLRAPVSSVGWWFHAETGEKMLWAFLILPGGTYLRFRFPKDVKTFANIHWGNEERPTQRVEQTWAELAEFLSEYNRAGAVCEVVGTRQGVVTASFTFFRPVGPGGFVYYPDPVVVDKSDWVLA